MKILNMISGVMLAAILVPALVAEKSASPSDSAPREAVILVHGIINKPFVMNGIAKQLEKDGFHVYNWGYPSTAKTIEEHAAQLHAFLSTVHEDRIHFVGFSQGAIILRYLLTHYAIPRAGRLVMIAPPNHGSEMAESLYRYAWFRGLYGDKSIKQLFASQNEFLQDMGIPKVEFGIIAGGKGDDKGHSDEIPGDDDGTIPVSSARLKGAADFIVVDHTHTMLVFSDDAARLTSLFLRTGHFSDKPPAEGFINSIAERLEEHVKTLSIKIPRRDYEQAPNLLQAASYIRRELAVVGGKVSEQEFFIEDFNQQNKKIQRGPYKNIIAAFGPESPERIVVGAHYDAYGPFPGADDNASGVAGLLELARRLGQDPPKMRVELVAYSMEEPPYFATPHMGSALHANALKESGIKVRAMICLEMIGYFTDKKKSQRYPIPGMGWFYPASGHFIAIVGRLWDGGLLKRVKKSMRQVEGLSVEGLGSPSWVPGVDFSDHRSYWAQGIPAVMVTDTAFLRNQNYHTAGDTLETLDYKRMALVVEGVRRAVQDLAR